MLEQTLDKLRPLIELFGDSPWVKGLMVILISQLVARFVAIVVNRGIRRLTSRTKTDLDDQVISLIHRPLKWSVMLLGVMLALVVAEAPANIQSIGRSTAVSLIILLGMIFAIRLSRILLLHISEHGGESNVIRTQTLPLFTNLASIIIIALGVYFVFNAWHVDMTAWLASAGIAGIAIGFAAKDTLANLFSGVFILADSPYKIGDYVVLDDYLRGKITHIGIRSTRLLTRDDVEVTIPNSIIGNSKVINESGGPHEKYRIRVKVSVAYGSDIDHVRDLLMQVADANQKVCDTPEHRVRFRSFGASGLEFELLCWIDRPELRGQVLDQLYSVVYKTFNEEGIEIPYDKQDLYIKEMPDGGGKAGLN